MQFDKEALKQKLRHLDEINKYPEYIDEVLIRNYGHRVSRSEVPRRWTGGGATSYIVEFNNTKAFVKIKHRSVAVESKLEEEECFINEPSIEHEYRMLKKAKKAGVSVPDIIFFDEYKDFQFLATEFVDQSFEDVISNLPVEELLDMWKDLTENVYRMYMAGLVHSDIHEYNIRCRHNRIVLIDLEECRELSQSCPFEESLDYTGRSEVSSLGDFPLCHEQNYKIHTNSLMRMKQVFKSHAAKAVEKYIGECGYDSSNGICLTIDHGKSNITYQSIKNDYFMVAGQRNKEDKRPKLVCSLNEVLYPDKSFTFIDVGSNNGLFGREMNRHFGKRCRAIGLEGFSKFNILARGLAFLEDCDNIEYYDFLCGEDKLDSLGISGNVFVNICSVWHHIQNKDEFIRQLKGIGADYIFFEMAIQEECYEGKTWETELQDIINKANFTEIMEIGMSEDYNRPLVLASKEKISEEKKHNIGKVYKKIYKKSLLKKLIRMVRR